jgi:regulator-associated protein of mTOR
MNPNTYMPSESALANLLSESGDDSFFAEPWHTEEFLGPLERAEYNATWRLKERMKTAGVALVLCLNLGTDPPDVIKPVPCARRECWYEPVGGSKQKKLEIIGNALQQQYEKWQGKAKYKQCLDPTSEDLRRVCINLRKAARSDRLLFHYNGHGVPMPTKNGELWLFGKHYTHYMPVAIFELKAWLGEPAIYVRILLFLFFFSVHDGLFVSLIHLLLHVCIL